jgi:hypothetical protein
LLRWCCLTGKASGELAAGRSGCYQATGLKTPGGLVNDATGNVTPIDYQRRGSWGGKTLPHCAFFTCLVFKSIE